MLLSTSSAHKHGPTRNQACMFWASVRSSPHRTKTRRCLYHGTLPVLARHLCTPTGTAQVFSKFLGIAEPSASALPYSVVVQANTTGVSSVQLIFHTRPCRRDISLTSYVGVFSPGIPHIVLGISCRSSIVNNNSCTPLAWPSAKTLASICLGARRFLCSLADQVSKRLRHLMASDPVVVPNPAYMISCTKAV